MNISDLAVIVARLALSCYTMRQIYVLKKRHCASVFLKSPFPSAPGCDRLRGERAGRARPVPGADRGRVPARPGLRRRQGQGHVRRHQPQVRKEAVAPTKELKLKCYDQKERSQGIM